MSAKKNVPKHVAIIMDGNGRWANKRFLPRIAGHKKGVGTLKKIIEVAGKSGIKQLTVFAFSSENWQRPQEEVSGLMEIFVDAIHKELARLMQDGVRLRFIGAREGLSEKVLTSLLAAETQTSDNTAIELNICFNYGGRWDIAHAANQIAARGEVITEQALQAQISKQSCGAPDLLIRTGGEMRISNFLLWQAAYSELFFSDKLWPDFDEDAFLAVLVEFSKRERRFGLTSAQTKANNE